MSTSHNEHRVLIGRLVGAHGIKGVLRVHPLTDYPARFLDMKTLYIEKPGKPPRTLVVTNVSSHDGKGQFLFSVEGIYDKDAADALRGYAVTVASDERVPLPEGEYWIDSLIGLDVLDSDSGEHLGTIEDVMSTGSNDIYQVRAEDGSAKLIPAIADIVREIDLNAGWVRIYRMEGLWD